MDGWPKEVNGWVTNGWVDKPRNFFKGFSIHPFMEMRMGKPLEMDGETVPEWMEK